jgi:hypothetical protein
MTPLRLLLLSTTLVMAAGPAFATGACPIKDSGPREQWKEQSTLEKKLVAGGWQVRRIKVDSHCYEVYGIDAQGKRVEAYFDPRTLEPAAKP